MARNPANVQVYKWTGVDARRRRVNGEQEAPSPAVVRAMLQRRGIRATRIRRKSGQGTLFQPRIKPKDIALVTRQVATLIIAGIPIAQSIGAVARGTENQRMVELLTRVRQDVEGGLTFSAAIQKYPRYFDRLYTSLAAAGEESGTLDRLMQKTADYLERMEEIRGKIRSAMFYPIMVLIVAMGVILVMLLFVIPEFEKLFGSLEGGLPALTRLLLDISAWFQEYWHLFLVGAASAFLLGQIFYRRSPKVQHLMDRIVLRVPIVGGLLKKAAIARFCRTLSTMFGAGVPLVDALVTVAGATGNRVYFDATHRIMREVSTGRPLETSMARTGLFPSMTLQMVATGEETGELEGMLDKTADYLENEVNDAVNSMSSLIEPIMIVLLGGIIGTIVVAMYLPIFKLAGTF